MNSSFSKIFPDIRLNSTPGKSLDYTLLSGEQIRVDRSSAVEFLKRKGVLQTSENPLAGDILRAMKQYEESLSNAGNLSSRAASLGKILAEQKHVDPVAGAAAFEGSFLLSESVNLAEQGQSSSLTSPDNRPEDLANSSSIRLRRSPLLPPIRKELVVESRRTSPGEVDAPDQVEINKINSEKIRLVDYLKQYSDPKKGLLRLKRIIPHLTYVDFRMTREELQEDRFQELNKLTLLSRANAALSGAYKPDML